PYDTRSLHDALPIYKDDCEDLGIVKVDLLGLGMMSVIQDAFELCRERGRPLDLAHIPKDDPATFEMMQKADTIGVFQIESRAQIDRKSTRLNSSHVK